VLTAANSGSSLDDSEGIVDWHEGDYFFQLFTDFTATRACRVGPVGLQGGALQRARSSIFAVAWMNERLGASAATGH